MQQKTPKYARAYIGDLPWLSREEQVELCRAAVESLGLPPLTAIYGPHEWGAFVLELHSTDVAVLPRLFVLDERPLAKGERPGTVFYDRVLELTDACAFVCALDVTQNGGQTWRRSTDRQEWRAFLKRAHYSITRGRALKSGKAKEMAKISHDPELSTRPPGLEKHWKEQRGTLTFERVRQHWIDQSMTAKEAIANAPTEAGALSTASVAMWTRIFGGRTPHSKTFNK